MFMQQKCNPYGAYFDICIHINFVNRKQIIPFIHHTCFSKNIFYQPFSKFPPNLFEAFFYFRTIFLVSVHLESVLSGIKALHRQLLAVRSIELERST